jgi:hypothetical protein
VGTAGAQQRAIHLEHARIGGVVGVDPAPSLLSRARELAAGLAWSSGIDRFPFRV